MMTDIETVLNLVKEYLEKGYVIEHVFANDDQINYKLEEYLINDDIDEMMEYILNNYDVAMTIIEFQLRKPRTKEHVIIDRNGTVTVVDSTQKPKWFTESSL